MPDAQHSVRFLAPIGPNGADAKGGSFWRAWNTRDKPQTSTKKHTNNVNFSNRASTRAGPAGLTNGARKKKLATPEDHLFHWDLLPVAPPRRASAGGTLQQQQQQQQQPKEPAETLTPTSDGPSSQHTVFVAKSPTKPAPDYRITFKSAQSKQRSIIPDHEFDFVCPLFPREEESTTLCSFRSSRCGIGRSMADEIPVIPKVNTLEVRTGNIVNWNRLKRKPNHTPTEELTECITATVKKVLDNSDKTELQYVTDMECVDRDMWQPLNTDERGELKVIIKVFICSAQEPPKLVKEAVEKSMAELGVYFVETVLLSLSMFQTEDEITVEMIKPYWQCLEELVSQERVLSIGVAELNKTKLEELYEWAKVKPCIDQMNLASCCVMPKDLIDYAKGVDIQLQTHSDPPELLPGNRLQEAIRQCGTEQDAFGWLPLWVARYSVLVKCRGIIKSKGYVLRCVRDPHRRN